MPPSEFDDHQLASAGLWVDSLPTLLPVTIFPFQFSKRSGPRNGIVNRVVSCRLFRPLKKKGYQNSNALRLEGKREKVKRQKDKRQQCNRTRPTAARSRRHARPRRPVVSRKAEDGRRRMWANTGKCGGIRHGLHGLCLRGLEGRCHHRNNSNNTIGKLTNPQPICSTNRKTRMCPFG